MIAVETPVFNETYLLVVPTGAETNAAISALLGQRAEESIQQNVAVETVRGEIDRQHGWRVTSDELQMLRRSAVSLQLTFRVYRVKKGARAATFWKTMWVRGTQKSYRDPGS